MPRKHHLPHPEFPYHVTARSHNGVCFYLPISAVWNIMNDYLYFIHHAYGVRIHSFVLMSNHFHLLISTPNSNLSTAMNYFMRETSKEINRLSGKTNQVYGGQFYRSLIENNFYFHHVYKYVYRNPVTAGLAEKCEDYPYSSLNSLLGQRTLHFPLVEDTILFDKNDPGRTLEWLNTTPNKPNYETLRKALKRKTMKFPKNRWGENRHTLEMHRF